MMDYSSSPKNQKSNGAIIDFVESSISGYLPCKAGVALVKAYYFSY